MGWLPSPGAMCEPDALVEAVRGLRIADPGLGFRPLLAKLREQQPDLGAGNKEVREALIAVKAEGKARLPPPPQPPPPPICGSLPC